MVVADQGKLDEGLRLLQQAAALHELDNRRGHQAFCFAIHLVVHAQRGEIAAAELALGEARRYLWPGCLISVRHRRRGHLGEHAPRRPGRSRTNT